MKKLLSALLALVFLNANVFAIHGGGPDFGEGETVATVGTYSGVLIPKFDAGNHANSIGLFSIGVPDTGVATGSLAIFLEGAGYEGTITGVADPLGGELNALIDAMSTFSLFDPLLPGVDLRLIASGSINAKISDEGFNSNIASSSFSFATTRITGTADIDILAGIDNNGAAIVNKTVSFTVDGFKQSSEVAASDIALNGAGG